MKKIKKFVIYFSVFFAFLCGFMFVSNNNVKAYDFHINTKDGIGKKYDKDGYITEFKDSIVIYATPNKTDKSLVSTEYDGTKYPYGVRFTNFEIVFSNGVSTGNIKDKLSLARAYDSHIGRPTDKNSDLFTKYGFNYDYAQSHTIDMITINNLNSLFTASAIKDTKELNILEIRISLEYKQSQLGGWLPPKWIDHKEIDFYNSNGDKTSNALMYKTTEQTLKETVEASFDNTQALYLHYNLDHGTVGGEVFYSKYNENIKDSDYYLKVGIPFFVKSNSNISISIQDLSNTVIVSDKVYPHQISDGSAEFNVYTYNMKDIFTKDGFNIYTITKMSYSIVDCYGISANASDKEIISPNPIKFTIDNDIPDINKVVLSSDTVNPIGAIDVNVLFDFSNLNFEHNSYTFYLKGIAFTLGEKLARRNNETEETFTFSDTQTSNVQKSYVLKSNEGLGNIGFKFFTGKLVDKYGNEKIFTTVTKVDSEVKGTIELKANSEGSYISSSKVYYYNKGTFDFTLTLAGRVNTTIESIYLVNSKTNDNYMVYNSVSGEKVVKTSADKEEFNLSTVINEVSDYEFDSAKLNNICVIEDDELTSCESTTIDIQIYFNHYQDITLSQDKLVNQSKFNIQGFGSFDGAIDYDLDKIVVTNMDNASKFKVNTCEVVNTNGVDTLECDYQNTNSLDGISKISIQPGTFALSNGLTNKLLEFHVISNNFNPTVSIKENPDLVKYDGIYYYKGHNNINLTIKDNYCESGSLTYYFVSDGNKGKSTTVNFTCSNNKASEDVNIFEIPLPSEDGTYSLHYAISSDGIATEEKEDNNIYVSRNKINTNGVNVKINDDLEFKLDNQKHFNYISVGIDGLSSNNLLDIYKIKVNKDIEYGEFKFTGNSGFKKYDVNNRIDFKDKNGVNVEISVILVDLLGNTKESTYTVILDTVKPNNPNYDVTIDSDNRFVINITNYEDYDNGDKVLVTYGEELKESLTCTKGVDSKCEFTIDKPIFTLEAKDMANNKSSKSTYTAKKTLANITNNYINIAPFASNIYSDEDVHLRIYKVDYTIDEVDITKINTTCSSAIISNCYVDVNLKKNQYEVKDDQFNISLESLNLKADYSYIFKVTLANNANPLLDDKGNIPRVNLELVDNKGPELDSTSISSNPKIVSDNPNNSREFEFDFKVKDRNLNQDSKFEYVIINNEYIYNYSLDNKKFDEYLNVCPKNLSKYEGVCGQWSSGLVEYSNISDGFAIGKVIINKELKMINNTNYDIFIRVSDTLGNSSIHLINEFLNVSESIKVTYKDGEDPTIYDVENNVIKTFKNDATIMIDLLDELESKHISIVSILVDGMEKTNIFHLVGTHKIVISDNIGNVTTINTLIGSLSMPTIDIFNKYNDEFYKVSGNNEYAYNADTLKNLYIKVSGTNIDSITISGQTYIPGDDVFDKMTNVTGDNEHGIRMDSIGIEFNDGTTIIAHSSTAGENTIHIKIDNIAPEIEIADGLKDNIEVIYFGSKYIIKYNGENSYKFSSDINYQSGLTYLEFFKGMNLKIDGMKFEEISNSLNLIVTKDGNKVNNFKESLSSLKGGSIIQIQYFDAAGNLAKPFTISYNITDTEAPTISSNFTPTRVVEANTDVKVILDEVSIFDNYDSLENITLNITINGQVIFNNKANLVNTLTYNFDDVKEYNLAITLTDSLANTNTVTQTVISKDTTAPSVDINTIIDINEIEVSKPKVLNLPKFIDSDKLNSVYYPGIIEVYYDSKLVDINLYHLDFDLSNHKATITFNTKASLGDYVIRFVVNDKYNNVGISRSEFKLVDKEAPNIIIYNNDKIVESDTIEVAYKDQAAFNLGYKGIDNYDGILKVSKSGSVNLSIPDTYTLTFTCEDHSHNKTSRNLNVVVKNDTEAPSIDKVSYGDFVLSPTINENSPILNKINSSYDYVKVEASDNVRVSDMKVSVNGMDYNINSEIVLSDSTLNNPYSIITVTVIDNANNKTVKKYYVVVDSYKPTIEGVNNKYVYEKEVNLVVSDNNLESVYVYKDGELIKKHLNSSSFTSKFNLPGNYKIVSKDSYGNSRNCVFKIVNELVVHTSESDKLDVNNLYLAKASFDKNHNIVVNFSYGDYEIKDNDEVYIVVKKQGEEISHIVYSCNGALINANKNITLDGMLIEGENNANLVEQIGEDYYVYLAVKASQEVVDQNSDKDYTVLINTIIIIVSILMLALVIFLLIKFRRKVRAA